MLAARVSKIKPSATAVLTSKLEDLKRKGYDIVSFTLGQPDFPTPKYICDEAIESIKQDFTKYTVSDGILELREAICNKLRDENNVDYEPNQICVSVGAKQALVNAMLAICDIDDEILLPVPCWVSYEEMVKLAGGTPVFVQVNQTGRFSLDLDAIKKAITPKTKAILINSPNNPSGAVYSEESLRELADLAMQNDFYIISDEVYEKIIYDNKKHFSIASISEKVKDRCILVNGFSKAYSMTGWRVGYSAANKEITKAIVTIQGNMTASICSISQKAALTALKGPQEEVSKMVVEYKKRRDYLLARLNNIVGIKCDCADGTFYLLPDISYYIGKCNNGKKIENAVDLSNFLLEEGLVSIVPGEAFNIKNRIRISYATSMENIIKGVDRIEQTLKLLV